MKHGIGKQKLGIRVISSRDTSGGAVIDITEYVQNGKNPYRAAVVNDLTKKQALALGLLLIRAAQQ
jgi:hypothetical protein